jgi:chromate transporter
MEKSVFAPAHAPAGNQTRKDNHRMSLPVIPSPTARARPTSLKDLFWSFTWLAMQGFGGVLAVVQRELVDKKQWMTLDEFVEDWAAAQTMPGPNVVNLCIMIGERYFGWRGALVALAGILTMPLVVLIVIALLYAQVAHWPEVQGALRGMGAVAAGLIAAVGLKMMPALRKNPLGLPLCALFSTLCFVAVAWLRWPLVMVLPLLGLLACSLTFLRLRG